MSARKMRIHSRSGSYDVRIGPGSVAELARGLQGSKRNFIVISDLRLNAARSRIRNTLLMRGHKVQEIRVQGGERLKELRAAGLVYGKLLHLGADRSTILVALGGGSIGDFVGFIAATYMRGVRWINIPTTLLAQVDSSIGGKTGINHSGSKNLIGAIHPPSQVICDARFLQTLPEREWISGLGEVVKYGLAYDPGFLSYVSKNLGSLRKKDSPALVRVIQRSLEFKRLAVEKDEFESSGAREVLNLGHTLGHALESETKYRRYRHGEAVLLGLRFALALSQIRGYLAEAERRETYALLDRIPVPAIPRRLRFSSLVERMRRDKKAKKGEVRMVLLNSVGDAFTDGNIPERDLALAFRMAFSER